MVDKEITDFVLGEFGYFIDLKDAPLAISVTPNDGDIILHEGAGKGRLHGYMIEGESVDDIYIDIYKQNTCLFIQYKRGNFKEEHIVGIVNINIEKNAALWVQAVKDVYKKKKDQLEKRAEGFRSGKWRNNPVVHDILSAKLNRVLPGDYLNSSKSYPIHAYKELWQDKYVTLSLEYLKEETGFKDDIEIQWYTPPQHHYPYLVDKICYTRAGYDSRVTQPLEIMFNKGPREDKLGIFPLGIVSNFAIVYVNNYWPSNKMSLQPKSLMAENFTEFCRIITKTKYRNMNCFFCTQADTAVHYLLNDAIMKNLINSAQLMTASAIHTLGDWLIYHHANGVLVCDIGIAHQVINYLTKTHPISVDYAFVPYDKPITVGEAFRKDDPLWGNICARALEDTLNSQDVDVKKSIAKTIRTAADIGIQWFKAA